MGDVLRIAIGPTLSVLFFLVGYRRTVGARKERAHAAQVEIERLLVRRVIVDGYTPTWNDLSRLIERKADQHRVKASDLPAEPALMRAVYTEVLENEFVQHADRQQILQRIDVVIAQRQQAEAAGGDLDAAADVADRAHLERQRRRMVALMGALATAVGTIAAASSTFSDRGNEDPAALVLVTAAISMFGVVFVALLLRSRERLEERDGPAQATRSAQDFEREIECELGKLGYAVIPGSGQLDFVIVREDRRIGIEARHLTRPNRDLLERAARLASRGVEGESVDEVLLVLPRVPKGYELSVENVKVVDCRGLRAYLGPAPADPT